MQSSLPVLPLASWKDTKLKLHLYMQMLGKVKLALMPRKNHWWNITLFVDHTGITTGRIYHSKGTFQLSLNFTTDKLEFASSWTRPASFPMGEGVSVAEFYDKLIRMLSDAGVRVKLWARPYDLPEENRPFTQLTDIVAYDKEALLKYWQMTLWVEQVLSEFSGRFYGKSCPVHIYWHHMDLTLTRFSGNRAPALRKEASIVEKEAYSHEVVSFGFWPGDANTPAPAFYAYTYPSPGGLEEEPLQPQEAQWIDANGSPMALLMYDDIREKENPKESLLQFLESAYTAGAKRAGWDMAKFQVPALQDL